MKSEKAKKILKEGLLVGRDIMIYVSIYLVISTTMITHAKVPTGSMIPTIEVNDHLVINRLPYYFNEPKPGEIVVFHQEDELIKRVIGVPGDTLDIQDGDVYINGNILDEPYLAKPHSTNSFMVEDIKFPIQIPKDMYFLLGDNRNNSEDSRYFGMIHRDAIYAKSLVRVWPLNRLGVVK